MSVLFCQLQWRKDQNKEKVAGIGPFFKKSRRLMAWKLPRVVSVSPFVSKICCLQLWLQVPRMVSPFFFIAPEFINFKVRNASLFELKEAKDRFSKPRTVKIYWANTFISLWLFFFKYGCTFMWKYNFSNIFFTNISGVFV